LYLYCAHDIFSGVTSPSSITLRAARDFKGWTQEELEAKSGVNQATISAIERGLVVNPTWDTVTKLSKALEIDARRLRFGTESAVAS